MSVTDSNILDTLYSGTTTALNFHYDNLMAPPIGWLLSPTDIEDLKRIALSVKLSGNIRKKLQCIKDILKPKGFIHLAGGTNRVVYYHPDVPGVIYKIALDAIGIRDNPAEFMNQRLIKPYCCKVFECSPCGTIASFERVERITSLEEFESVADDIYYIISRILLGKYVLEDIGINFFLNWGIRTRSSSGYAFGPVILDFPYIYELDGGKLFCNKILDNGQKCGGEIDYDDGFNFLCCTKCGAQYNARDLAKASKQGSGILIRKKGRLKDMEIKLVRGNETIASFNGTDTVDYMKKPAVAKSWRNRVHSNDDPIMSRNDIKKTPMVGIRRGHDFTSCGYEDHKTEKKTDFEFKITRGEHEEEMIHTSNYHADNKESSDGSPKIILVTPNELTPEKKHDKVETNNVSILEKITGVRTKSEPDIIKAEPPVKKEDTDKKWELEDTVSIDEYETVDYSNIDTPDITDHEEKDTKEENHEEESTNSEVEEMENPDILVIEAEDADSSWMGCTNNIVTPLSEAVKEALTNSGAESEIEEQVEEEDETSEEVPECDEHPTEDDTEESDSVDVDEKDIDCAKDDANHEQEMIYTESETEEKEEEKVPQQEENNNSFQMNSKQKMSLGDILGNY